MNNSIDDLRGEMEKHGAREFELVALSLDPVRGLEALRYAVKRGADNPVSYAIKMFDNPDWHPSGESKRVATNVHVDRKCAACGGDRFVAVTAGLGLYEETYAPCSSCNAKCDTTFWTASGERHATLAR